MYCVLRRERKMERKKWAMRRKEIEINAVLLAYRILCSEWVVSFMVFVSAFISILIFSFLRSFPFVYAHKTTIQFSWLFGWSCLIYRVLFIHRVNACNVWYVNLLEIIPKHKWRPIVALLWYRSVDGWCGLNEVQNGCIVVHFILFVLRLR